MDIEGHYIRHELEMNLESGQEPQFIVSANSWFASSVKNPDSYSLVGCTVALGFDFNDFELGERKELTQHYPMHEVLIKHLTRH